MNAGQVRKIIKRSICVGLQPLTNLHDAALVDANGKLTQEFGRFDHRLTKLLLQFSYQWMVRSIEWFGAFFLFLDRGPGCGWRSSLLRFLPGRLDAGFCGFDLFIFLGVCENW